MVNFMWFSTLLIFLVTNIDTNLKASSKLTKPTKIIETVRHIVAVSCKVPETFTLMVLPI